MALLLLLLLPLSLLLWLLLPLLLLLSLLLLVMFNGRHRYEKGPGIFFGPERKGKRGKGRKKE